MKKAIKTDSKRDSRVLHNQLEIITGGLIAIDVVAVIQLLGLPSLSKWLSVSLYCFAVSIPLLTLFLLTLSLLSQYARFPRVWWYSVFFPFGAGGLAAVIGVDSLFHHLSFRAGRVFAITSMLGLLAYVHFYWKISRTR